MMNVTIRDLVGLFKIIRFFDVATFIALTSFRFSALRKISFPITGTNYSLKLSSLSTFISKSSMKFDCCI
jgi:hypothetical protein